jgi:transcriptional regulator with XRE-family HTH domain
MATLQISPKILRWAADQRGLSLDELVGLLGTPSKLEEFKAGKLSIAQTETLARKTHIPFDYFFLDTPSSMNRHSLPDLRQLPDHAPLSIDFFDTLDDVLRKQQWYQDYMRDHGMQPLPFVGKYAFNAQHAPADVADDIRSTLQITEQDRRESKDHKAFYNLLSKKFKVSQLVIARRALHLGKIDWANYQTIANASKKISNSDGGSPFRSFPIRKSKRLTKPLLQMQLAVKPCCVKPRVC